MSAQIRSITGTLTATQRGGEPNGDLIEKLQRMLERAQAGDLQCLAYAGLHADGSQSYGWSTFAKDDATKLLGQMHVMGADMAQHLIVE